MSALDRPDYIAAEQDWLEEPDEFFWPEDDYWPADDAPERGAFLASLDYPTAHLSDAEWRDHA